MFILPQLSIIHTSHAILQGIGFESFASEGAILTMSDGAFQEEHPNSDIMLLFMSQAGTTSSTDLADAKLRMAMFV